MNSTSKVTTQHPSNYFDESKSALGGQASSLPLICLI